VCLGCFVNIGDLPTGLSLLGSVFTDFSGLVMVITRAEGPPTSITLFTAWGSNLITLDFTMVCAVYSPKQSLPDKW
jgi:hypothetical protein